MQSIKIIGARQFWTGYPQQTFSLGYPTSSLTKKKELGHDFLMIFSSKTGFKDQNRPCFAQECQELAKQ